ncbi:hypothetical protein [Natronomonas sp. EA1]|uniref:hypothetical protein n=1 Tax=Natronomonas sp. EA1 TaxID=3421655 RepID=UPI003EBFEC96
MLAYPLFGLFVSLAAVALIGGWLWRRYAARLDNRAAREDRVGTAFRVVPAYGLWVFSLAVLSLGCYQLSVFGRLATDLNPDPVLAVAASLPSDLLAGLAALLLAVAMGLVFGGPLAGELFVRRE